MKHEISRLVEKYMEFSNAGERAGLMEFSVWLHHNVQVESALPPTAPDAQIERDIAYLLNRLGRFSRYYTRQVLAKYGIVSLDEFYFLLSISRLGSPSKNEVYRDTITDLPTGAQILRRLAANGMVTESADKKDRRVKRVRLTPKGERTREKIFKDFSETVRLKTGNLTRPQKETLHALLNELHRFHNGMYQADPGKPVSYLIQKYLL